MNFENGTVAIVSGIRGNVMNGRTSRSSMRFAWVAIGVALGLTTAGCRAQQASPPNAAAAPAPTAAAARIGGPMCGGTDVHTRHVDEGMGCATCHPCGAVFGFDVPYTYPKGTTTAGGTLVRAIGGNPTTCTVACHSPMGAPLKPVAWTAGPRGCPDCHVTSVLPSTHPVVGNPNPTSTDCAVCHTSTTSHTAGTTTLVGHAPAWMDQASAGFHAVEANKGLAKCQGCHGAALTGLASAVSCGQCHDTVLPVGVASWKVNCVMCHGGGANQSGAPPKATWGNAADATRVGAHSTHVAGTATSPAVACGDCHLIPADALAAGHIDATPTAEVAWSGLAVASGASPAWTRGTATCSNTYCHGQFTNGNTANALVWTQVGTGKAACGTCHGLPPSGTHPAVSASLTGCAGCHTQTMSAAGQLIAIAAGGKHLDGLIQASGGSHPAGWMDTASASFHAFSANNGISSCQGCHGVNLDGVGGTATTSCATCHGATWKTNCTFCHGGTADATGAPPKGTWGFRTDANRIGAHTKHVVGGAISPAFACSACHVNPASALSAGHLDGPRATVTWSGISVAMNATPSWNPTTLTCSSTSCHGGYSGRYQATNNDTGMDISVNYAGKNASPAWTGAPMTCTSCHETSRALLPGAWHDGSHGGSTSTARNDCNVCHPGVNTTGTAFTDPSRHVNGVIDVVNPLLNAICKNCHF